MPRSGEAIARVRLARSMPRLLALPLLLVAAGVALPATGLLLVGGITGLAMAGAGAFVVLLAILAAAIPLSVGVHVEQSVVRVSWMFGRQVHLLTPGSLTRIHLRGEGASRLRGGFGFGWALGRAVLRDQEEIHVVRLAPTESVILIPTARGRLAIATSDEQHLIETLTAAAQARARAAEELLESAPAEEELPAPGAEEFDPRLLTGIERELYEEWIVRRQAQAMEDAARAAQAPAPTAAPIDAPITDPVPVIEPRRIFRRPSWASRRAEAPRMTSARAAPGRVRALPISRPRPSWLLPIIPLAAAGAAWAVGVYVGEMPQTGSDGARLTALALVLAGPGTTIAAIMARTWWPRISGVVVTGGLVASVFIGRSLLTL